MAKASLVVGTMLLAISLSSAAWGQSAQPSFEEPGKERPARLPYEPGRPFPEGYRLQTSMNKPLLIAGIAVGGAGYVFGVAGAMDHGFEDNSGYLLVPLAGPWLMLAAGPDPAKPCSEDAPEGCADGGISYRVPAVVLDGVVQALGAVLIVGGLTTTRHYLQRKDLTLSVVPASFGGTGYGLGAVGTF